MSSYDKDLAEARSMYAVDELNQEHKVILVSFNGPQETPYEGGDFMVEISFGSEYPVSQPTAVFRTRIWSPSVDPRTLEMRYESSPHNVTAAIEHIEALFYSDLNEKSGETARFWTKRFAGNREEQDLIMLGKLDHLVEIGFPEDRALLALSAHDFNVQDAIEDMCDNIVEETEEPWRPSAPIAHGEAGPSGLQENEDDDDDEDESQEPEPQPELGTGAGPSNA